jgi:hypothetical protein
MGEVLDFSAYKARSTTGSQKEKEGFSVEAAPPFLIFRKHQAGVIRGEWLLLSERLLRWMLNQFPLTD